MIIERADHGDRDYVKHSLDLFVDFVDIFVRLLVILVSSGVTVVQSQLKFADPELFSS